jgi:hypothetical protein
MPSTYRTLFCGKFLEFWVAERRVPGQLENLVARRFHMGSWVNLGSWLLFLTY